MNGSGELTTTGHGGVGLSAQADKLPEKDSGNPENMEMFLMTGMGAHFRDEGALDLPAATGAPAPFYLGASPQEKHQLSSSSWHQCPSPEEHRGRI